MCSYFLHKCDVNKTQSHKYSCLKARPAPQNFVAVAIAIWIFTYWSDRAQRRGISAFPEKHNHTHAGCIYLFNILCSKLALLYIKHKQKHLNIKGVLTALRQAGDQSRVNLAFAVQRPGEALVVVTPKRTQQVKEMDEFKICKLLDRNLSNTAENRRVFNLDLNGVFQLIWGLSVPDL